ncbi:unnamed protein product [Cochlearia groenlandica]
MNIATRIRRSFHREEKKNLRDDIMGVTDELIGHVGSFTVDTFKSFSLKDEEEEEEEEGTSSSANVKKKKKDLSDWQERHALLVLSKSKELSKLRFKLCPRLLKEHQFWRIYFQLVRNLVAKYEVLAIQQAKISRMAMEESETSETKGVYEVEMSETKQKLNTEPVTS